MRWSIPLLLPLCACWLTSSEIGMKQQVSDTGGTPTTVSPTQVPATGTPSGTTTSSGTTSYYVDHTCVDEDIGTTTGSFAVVGTTLGQGNDMASVCYGATTAGPDVVYLWQAPSSGCFSVDTLGVAFDSVLYVRGGDCGGSEVACNDDQSGTTLASQVGFEAEAGEDYLLVVDGTSVGEAGGFDLNIQESSLISANSNVGSDAGPFVGNNTFSDTSLYPDSCPYPSAQDHILAWTAPSSGTWRFSLTPQGTDFDSVLSLHMQCSNDALACQDIFAPNGGEVIDHPLYAGETLYIRIAGYDPSSYGYGYSVYEGDWELTVELLP